MDHKRTWQQSFLQTDYTNDYRSDIGVSPAFTITGAASGEESANRGLH